MHKKRIVFVHGNQTLRWSYAWVPWIVEQLEKYDVEIVAETFPDSIIARKKYWIEFLETHVKADEHTVLVGHSSGVLCANRYAENHKILGSVLIGAAYRHLNDELEMQSGYYDEPWQWDAIQKNQEWIVQFASIDDPYIPIEEARYVRDMLSPEYYEFTDRGHFFEGQDTFPELLDVLKQKLTLV